MKVKFPPKTTSNEVKDELAYCEEVITVIENEPKIACILNVQKKRIFTIRYEHARSDGYILRQSQLNYEYLKGKRVKKSDFPFQIEQKVAFYF